MARTEGTNKQTDIQLGKKKIHQDKWHMHQEPNPYLPSMNYEYQTLNSIFRWKLKEIFYKINTDVVTVHNW